LELGEKLVKQQASEILMEWCTMILKDFSITLEHDVLTSCTDSGSDVKRSLEQVFLTMQEWCILRMMHLVLAIVFGSHVNRKKSKNSEMREFISQCHKVVETVNKSKVLKSIFEANILTDFGHNIKIVGLPWKTFSSASYASGIR